MQTYSMVASTLLNGDNTRMLASPYMHTKLLLDGVTYIEMIPLQLAKIYLSLNGSVVNGTVKRMASTVEYSS